MSVLLVDSGGHAKLKAGKLQLGNAGEPCCCTDGGGDCLCGGVPNRGGGCLCCFNFFTYIYDITYAGFTYTDAFGDVFTWAPSPGPISVCIIAGGRNGCGVVVDVLAGIYTSTFADGRSTTHTPIYIAAHIVTAFGADCIAAPNNRFSFFSGDGSVFICFTNCFPFICVGADRPPSNVVGGIVPPPPPDPKIL